MSNYFKDKTKPYFNLLELCIALVVSTFRYKIINFRVMHVSTFRLKIIAFTRSKCLRDISIYLDTAISKNLPLKFDPTKHREQVIHINTLPKS